MNDENEFVAAVIERSEQLDARRPDPGRAAARARLRSHGLPSGRKLETWKYTPITAFYRGALADAAVPSVSPIVLDGHEATGITVRRDGATPEVAARQSERLGCARHPLACVTAALADETVAIDVADHAAVALPIEVVTRFAGDTSRCVRLTVRLGRNARVVLLERQSASVESLQVVQVDVGPGASLHHHRIEEPSAAPCWSLVSVDVAEGAAYHGSLYAFAAAPRRCDLHVMLRGAGARADLVGASAASGTETFDLAAIVEHLGPRTTCRQRFHGVAGGRGTLTFNGRIEIHGSASDADAALTSRNLLLAPTARVNAKPELEINNRDVKCSHGATVGQLDPAQIFYLRSRGIDLEDARRLLLRAFVDVCLTPEAVAAGVEQLFAQALADGWPA
jgi:Fe-S cluster assembly protein SufD